MAEALCSPARQQAILDANAADLEAARGHISEVMLDRLALTPERISAMAKGIREVADLPDPVGKVLRRVERPNGLVIEKTAVPMGVIAIIYESRPNVTSDAAALAIKSGNACILRCGREAWRSANAIVAALREGLQTNGLPETAVCLIEDTTHASANALMTAVGYVDLLIPRGGAGLIRACVENAKAITLDNSDHKLDIEYEEVTVTRRLYRSGDSEYLLNGTGCRLKDINELFYDTGIGKEGYSIIGQGQIDKILSGKPEERRELFDEAAGIVKFKRRKATALKKLDEEQQNLVRVTDILSELTRQLGPLERQSETARVYLKKKEELKILDVNMYLAESAHIKEQLKETEEKYQISQNELQQTQTQFDQTKAMRQEQIQL